MCESTVRLSCLTLSADGKFFAAAEGEPNDKGQANIYLYEIATQRLVNCLNFFEKGIQSMTFAANGKILVAVGVASEGLLCVFNV
jgi:Tol biopolymer transport system component